jgi:hypothetical protein
MRIFEITDFIDRASDIAQTGKTDRVVDLAEEIKQAGSNVVRRVIELLTSPQSTAASPKPAAQPAAAPQPAATSPQPAAQRP